MLFWLLLGNANSHTLLKTLSLVAEFWYFQLVYFSQNAVRGYASHLILVFSTVLLNITSKVEDWLWKALKHYLMVWRSLWPALNCQVISNIMTISNKLTALSEFIHQVKFSQSCHSLSNTCSIAPRGDCCCDFVIYNCKWIEFRWIVLFL